jgi:taurine dioxygenase
MEINPLSDVIGAEIIGLDLAQPMDDASFATVHKAHLDYQVLYFRDQDITPDQHVAFSRRFGTPQVHSADHLNLPDNEFVVMISTKRENGQFIGLPDAGAMWHTDQSFLNPPSLGTTLYAVELPDSGGDTGFCNLYAAHDGLPDDLRREVAHRRGKFMTGRFRTDRPDSGQMKLEQKKSTPENFHPLIRIHPETGRKVLFFSEQHMGGIEGLPDDEAKDLIARIAAHCSQDEYVYWHQWKPGDLAFWDNRCTAHKADLSRMNDPTYVRHMHRTTILPRAAA